MACTAEPASSAGLRAQYTALVEALVSLNATVDEKLKVLEAKEEAWDRVLKEVDRQAALCRSKVELNIGGHAFAAARETLLRWPCTYFHALLGTPGRWQPCDDSGAYFIDRDPSQFQRIMTSLRSGEPVDYEGLLPNEKQRLRAEVDYYQLPTDTKPVRITWDPKRCGRHLAMSQDNRTVTNTGGGRGYNAVAGTAEVSSFKVRIQGTPDVMIGIVKGVGLEENGVNYDRSGWFISSHNGSLYSGAGDFARVFSTPFAEGSVVEVKLDRAASNISFSVNGGSPTVAFSSIGNDRDDLLPCVELCPNAWVVLED